MHKNKFEFNIKAPEVGSPSEQILVKMGGYNGLDMEIKKLDIIIEIPHDLKIIKKFQTHFSEIKPREGIYLEMIVKTPKKELVPEKERKIKMKFLVSYTIDGKTQQETHEKDLAVEIPTIIPERVVIKNGALYIEAYTSGKIKDIKFIYRIKEKGEKVFFTGRAEAVDSAGKSYKLEEMPEFVMDKNEIENLPKFDEKKIKDLDIRLEHPDIDTKKFKKARFLIIPQNI